MMFNNGNYMPAVLLACAVILFGMLSYDKRYYRWVKKYWFKERSLISYIRSASLAIALVLLTFSLLDIRGPAEIVTSEVPDQKTIVVIDTSASMLVEDVRPNRFKRGVFLARHFVRNAVGHQVSVVVFSDFAKRIIPFTDDRDLLEARLSAVEEMNLESGGSNIILAINQAIQYLLQESPHRQSGNIVLITDGEEHEWDLSSLAIPPRISIAIIGMGTQRGGKIPIRSAEGTFRGYKRWQGEEINSSLNEEFFRDLSGRARNSRYWIAHSFNMPSDDALRFLNETFERELSESEIVIRPVWTYPLIAAALVLLSIWGMLSNLNSFRIAVVLLALSASVEQKTIASSDALNLTPEAIRLLENFKSGALTEQEVVKLSEELLRSGQPALSQAVLLENLGGQGLDKLPFEARVNLGTAMLMEGKTQSGVAYLSELLEDLRGSKKAGSQELAEAIKNNILHALIQEEDNSQEDQQQDTGEGEDGPESESDSESQQGDGDQSSNDESLDQDDQGDEQEEEKQDDSDSDQDDQQEPEINEIENDDQADRPDSREIPALIEQIMNDDRALQQQQLDTSTRDSRRGRDIKDW
jgi:Ca-activated chloride channel homolog